jgi:hypothetical protein
MSCPYRVYTYLHSTYTRTHISIQYIYLFIFNAIKYNRLTSILSGTLHSSTKVVVLLHYHFTSWLSTFFNSISITTNCTYANTSESHISIRLFQIGLIRLISLQYRLLSPILLGLYWQIKFTFLPHSGNKNQCYWNYMGLVVVSQM